MSDSLLFDRIVEASGLSSVFARRSILRALEKEGLTPESLQPPLLAQALPHIRQALQVFLSDSEVESRMRQIRQLCR